MAGKKGQTLAAQQADQAQSKGLVKRVPATRHATDYQRVPQKSLGRRIDRAR